MPSELIRPSNVRNYIFPRTKLGRLVSLNFRRSQTGVEQGGKSPFSPLSEPISPSSILFEPISPSSLKFNFSFSPFSLLFPPISPSSQLCLGHFSLLPILFLPPLLTCPVYVLRSWLRGSSAAFFPNQRLVDYE